MNLWPASPGLVLRQSFGFRALETVLPGDKDDDLESRCHHPKACQLYALLALFPMLHSTVKESLYQTPNRCGLQLSSASATKQDQEK